MAILSRSQKIPGRDKHHVSPILSNGVHRRREEGGVENDVLGSSVSTVISTKSLLFRPRRKTHLDCRETSDAGKLMCPGRTKKSL